MMKGTANEDVCLRALKSMSFVHHLFLCGMMAWSDDPYLSCSSDAVALIEVNKSFPLMKYTTASSIKLSGTEFDDEVKDIALSY